MIASPGLTPRFNTDDLGRDYGSLLDWVRGDGQEVKPRGLLIKEFSPFVLELSEPDRCVVARKGFSRALMWLEIATLISGNFDKALFERFSPQAASLLSPQGSYGPRVHEQVGYVIDELVRDPDSRRAVVYFGRSTDLSYSEHYEQPCTMTWQFLIRDNKLNMVVNMRSWDLVWGLGYDIPSFVAVQDAVCKALMFGDHNAAMGKFTCIAGSAHVYERHFDLTPVTTYGVTLPSLSACTSKDPATEWRETVRGAQTAILSLTNQAWGTFPHQWNLAGSDWARASHASGYYIVND